MILIYFTFFIQDEDNTLNSIGSPGSDGSSNTLVSCMSSLPTDPQSPVNDPYSHEDSASRTGSNVRSSSGSGDPKTGQTYTINSENGIIDVPLGPGHCRSISGTFSISTIEDVHLVTSSSGTSTNLSSMTPEEPLVRTSDLSERDGESCDSESTVTSLSATLLHTDTENK